MAILNFNYKEIEVINVKEKKKIIIRSEYSINTLKITTEEIPVIYQAVISENFKNCLRV